MAVAGAGGEATADGLVERGGRSSGSILALRALGLGDFLTGVPAYRALRRAFPSYELALAAPAELAPLVPLTAAIDRLVPTHGLAPIPWSPHAAPEVAVNLHGCGPQSHRRLREVEPGWLIAFACHDYERPATDVRGRRTVAYVPRSDGHDGHDGKDPAEPMRSRWRADEHEVRRWCRLLAESAIPADPGDLDLVRPEPSAPAPGAVVVHPGAASGSRQWPLSRFAAVAGALRANSGRVVVTGSRQERPAALAVAAEAGIPEEEVLAGRTGTEELASQVATASLVISGDTGVAHLASAYRRPSVVLFGPVPPALWGPPPRAQHVTLWKGSGMGDPHGREADPALLRITAAEVVEAAERALSAGAAGDSRQRGR